MKCFNCYSEFLPTLSKPLCQECGFCYYCRDFLSCFHYDIGKNNSQKPKQSTSSSHKGNIQKWDSYNNIASTLAIPILEQSTALIVIDESVRRQIGKLHILELIQNITGPEMNCYVDIIPTGTSDNDVIRIIAFHLVICKLTLPLVSSNLVHMAIRKRRLITTNSAVR